MSDDANYDLEIRALTLAMRANPNISGFPKMVELAERHEVDVQKILDDVALCKKELGMTRCRSCGAFIEWIVTAKGKSMPVDSPTPAEGTVTIRTFNGENVEVMPHHATCPDAGRWRKSRPRGDRK